MCGGGFAPPDDRFSDYAGCAPVIGQSPKEITGLFRKVKDLPHIGRLSRIAHGSHDYRRSSVSYRGCAGTITHGSSATVIARMRTRSFSGNVIVRAPAGMSIA